MSVVIHLPAEALRHRKIGLDLIEAGRARIAAGAEGVRREVAVEAVERGVAFLDEAREIFLRANGRL